MVPTPGVTACKDMGEDADDVGEAKENQSGKLFGKVARGLDVLVRAQQNSAQK